MEWIREFFGEGKELSALQMSARAFVFFFITLIYLRVGGVRTLGKKSPVDMVIIIVLGSLIARGVTGASSFAATASASAVLVLTARLMAWLGARNKKVETMTKGQRLLLFRNGRFYKEAFRKANITRHEFFESLRLETQSDDPGPIAEAYMEVSGRISFIRK